MSFTITDIIQWYREQTLERKVSAVLLGAIILFALGLGVAGIIKRQQLKHNGVFYVARVYDITSSKNGEHYYIEYEYNQKRYTGSFKPHFLFKPNRVGAYIFIRLLPGNPAVHQYLDEGEVTDSLLHSLPKEGWKTLPDAPRQYLLDGNYIWYK